MSRKLWLAPCGLLVLCATSLVAARTVIARASRNRTYSQANLVPQRRVGLVLGCPRQTAGGWTNPFFESRMAAAAELYHQGKVDYLVVSGDNHVQGYDEPTDMKNALLARGVPGRPGLYGLRRLPHLGFRRAREGDFRPGPDHHRLPEVS